jgi:hypothetical protein
MSCVFREQKTLGHRNKIFNGGKIVPVLIFLMHKIETLSVNY